MAKQRKTYRPNERPDVEVFVDDVWCRGELRAWTQHDDDAWTADVQYRPPGENSSYIDTFLAELVRKDTVDRSGGACLARCRRQIRSYRGADRRNDACPVSADRG